MVVIAIIVVLAGLLFPAVQSVLERAKKVQAKNDLTQIVTAVNAYYTEYGKYPIADSDQGTEKEFLTTNKQVMDILRSLPGNDPSPSDGSANKYNPRKVVFMSPPDSKDPNNPKSGLDANGNFYDPWGKVAGNAEAGVYHIGIDGDYSSFVDNPYNANTGAGSTDIRQGVIAWSLGKDGGIGNKGDKNFTGSDDVISWQ